MAEIGFDNDISLRPNLSPLLNSPEEFLDLLPVGIYVCDRAGFITYYNRTAAELWGQKPATGVDAPR